jgi:hypothetical protein
MMKAFIGLALALLVGCTQDAFIDLEPGQPPVETDDANNAILMTVGDTLDFEVYAVTTGMETQGWSCDNDNPKDELTSSDDTIATVLGPNPLHTHVTINAQDVITDVFTVVAIREGIIQLHAYCGGMEGSLRIHVRERWSK